MSDTFVYDEDVFTKYSSADGITRLDPEDDAAHVVMGGDWRLPTREEWSLMQNQTNASKTYMWRLWCKSGEQVRY